MENRENLIQLYFTLGLHQSEIINILSNKHNVNISRSTLQRILSRLRLYRKKDYSDILEVADFIQRNLNLHGQLHGYRWMYLRCLQHGLTVTQETVRCLLQILDSAGVELRSRKRLRRRQYMNKGPNYLWHMDCYDKLKPYGICISGCIDGFSRKIIWLRAGPNSNDPRVIAGYYLNAIRELEGCPQTIRADLGTENVIVNNIQTSLIESVSNHQARRMPPFLLGTSQHNQRIEAWWSILRKHHSQFWINLFSSLKDDGFFSGSYLDKSLIQFCFLKIIQDELNEVAREWDFHRIAPSRNSISPSGIPFLLYNMPEEVDAHNYLQATPASTYDLSKEFCLFFDMPCDEDIYYLCAIVMSENDLTSTSAVDEASNLYKFLRTEISVMI